LTALARFRFFLHPSRDVALAVQYAPNVNMVGMFNVENKVGIARKWSGTKPWQIQLMGIAGRSSVRMAADMGTGFLQGIDQTKRSHIRLTQIVCSGVLNIQVRPLAQEDRLDLHRRDSGFASRLRRIAYPFTQAIEVSLVSGCNRWRSGASEQQATQLQPLLLMLDKIAYILATRAVVALADLFIHKSLEAVWQGDIHRTHAFQLRGFGKIWQERKPYRRYLTKARGKREKT